MSSLLTVTTAATARRLASEEVLRMEIAADVEPDASAVGALLDQASAAVERFCGRMFARETVQEAFRPTCWADVLILSRRPVASITSVVADGAALASADYEADPAAGMLWRLSGDDRTPWAARKIVVAYQAGYLLPGQPGRDLPHDIERATLIVAAALWAARGRDPLLRSESVDGVMSASYLDPRSGAGGLPPQAAELLAPWREVAF